MPPRAEVLFVTPKPDSQVTVDLRNALSGEKHVVELSPSLGIGHLRVKALARNHGKLDVAILDFSLSHDLLGRREVELASEVRGYFPDSKIIALTPRGKAFSHADVSVDPLTVDKEWLADYVTAA